jgi:hypothetical protein
MTAADRPEQAKNPLHPGYQSEEPGEGLWPTDAPHLPHQHKHPIFNFDGIKVSNGSIRITNQHLIQEIHMWCQQHVCSGGGNGAELDVDYRC